MKMKTKIEPKNYPLKDMMKRREFWIGIGTTLVVFTFLFRLFVVSSISQSVTPTVAVKTETKPTMSSTITSKPKVNTLADTTGQYTVVNGDNFYVISVKVCGIGKYFMSIQSQNNGMSLHAGDQIVVSCQE